MFGLADNPKLKDVKTVDDLNRAGHHHGLFHRHAAGDLGADALPEGEAARASPGSGANAPVEEIMAKRADIATIDNVAWPQLAEAGAGPGRLPAGDDCLQSKEMATDVGLAVDKKDTGVPRLAAGGL